MWDKAIIHINAGIQLWKINNIKHKEKQGVDFGQRLSHGNSWRCQEKEDTQKGVLRGHGKGYILVVSARMHQRDSHLRPILCEKAFQFYRRVHNEESADFNASQGWLDNF